MPHTCIQGLSFRCGVPSVAFRSHRLSRVQCAASPEGDAERPSSSKGKSFSGERRRRGRPAHLRSPDDSPLRDGNRDRLMGLLTERAAKTLAYYLIETNHNIHHWVNRFIAANPIPRDGNWDDVSGDTFLRTLLAMPIEEAMPLGRDPVFHNCSGSDVDPRSIAQRIMEIRAQLATEFIEDLKQVADDNKLLQLETLQASLWSTEDAIADGSAAARQTATSSGGSSPGGSGIARARSADEDDAAARAKLRRAKKSVLPPQPTPPNWRLRLEVEAQVRGDDDDDGGVASGGGGIPDSVMTGIISPTYVPPSSLPAVPAQPAAAAALPPPLHPEVAEMLPLIRASPSALTPEVAQMLSSMAVLSSGQLHPEIADALRASVAAGAKLHPEIEELLRSDPVALPAAAPPAPSTPASSSLSSMASASAPIAPLASSSSSGSAPLGQLSKPPVAPAGASAAAAAASAAAAAAAAPLVVAQQQKEPEMVEEENTIIALQNDTCLHSDDE